MHVIQRSTYTETAHFLAGHPGLCKNIHGHSYKWTVVVKRALHSADMVMDFSKLKNIMTVAIDHEYDHALVVDNLSYMDLVSKNPMLEGQKIKITAERPTAEVMAKEVYHFIENLLPKHVQIVLVICRETRNNEATYYGE